MSEKQKPTKCRTMFSPSEEEVISKFLISCWKKKLRVPQILLYDALKKHVDKYPRKTRAKDNRPSHFWRQRFFLRNPHVQEAYDNYKSSQHKDFEVVSDQLLNSFISDLAGADKPIGVDGFFDSSDVVEGEPQITKVKKKRFGNGDGKVKKLSKVAVLKNSSDKPRRGRPPKILATGSVQHKRSKSVGLPGTIRSFDASSPAAKGGNAYERRKSLGGFKVSPNLFNPKKSVLSSKVTGQKINKRQVESPTNLDDTKKNDQPLRVSKKRSEVPADAIPLESIKFEEGTNIEAMDGHKWYKAKILEVYHDKKHILVHFNGWGKRFDTIFPMTSPMIRGSSQADKKVELKKFNVGDDVLSQWTDGNFYPGTVISVKDSGSCVVMFYDGLKKLVRPGLLKPITSEKEKDEAMKEAQNVYLLPYDQPTSSVPSPQAAGIPFDSRRRYRTSANDRERRVSARRASIGDRPASGLKKKKPRKRKYEQTLPSSPPPTGATSPVDEYKFQAKQARLDKITHTLLDKVDVFTPTTSTAMVPARRNISSHLSQEDSEDLENPLVIDEDDEGRRSVEASATTSATDPGAGKDSSWASDADENLHQLADAALSSTGSVPGKVVGPRTSGMKREEAGQALLQLAQSAPDKIEEKAIITFPIDPDELVKLSFERKIEIAMDRLLKGDLSIVKVAAELNLKKEEVHDALAMRPGVVLGASEPNFLVPSEEDAIVNWIHDITDLGWGIKNVHILNKIKSFLDSESFVVLFDDDNSINMPSASWLDDFLSRHPEIFPGREKPMSRFRFDREGFEEWLVRWVAMLRSSAVRTNAVYYCDEAVWDINARLPEVKFTHGSQLLDSTHTNGNKITTISCVGANGDALSPFFIFPDNEKSEKIKKENYTEHIAFSHRGALNSNYFLFWLESVFVPGIPQHKRPVALLVDAQLESVDYKILKFAEDNDIVLYRFLSQGAHFIQHPDQKLFGRLRMQWKKAIFAKFIKENGGRKVATRTLTDNYNQEFCKLASSATIKMCFELTKLYTPLPESLSEESPPKEKKNKRKNANPKPYVTTSGLPVDERKKKPTSRRSTNTPDVVQVEGTISASDTPLTAVITPTRVPAPPRPPQVLESSPALKPSPSYQTRDKVKTGVGAKSKSRRSSSNLRSPRNAQPMKAETSEVAPVPPPEAVNQTLPVTQTKFKKGQLVLAKWTDCKLYSATIVNKVVGGNYKIRYFDGLVKIVNADFLRVWNSDSMPSMKSPPHSPRATLPSGPAPTSADQNQNLRRGILPVSAKRRSNVMSTRKHLGMRGARNTSEAIGKKDKTTVGRNLVYSSSKPGKPVKYKVGDTVLCKWTDRRMYCAIVLKQISEERFLVKYYDNRKKIVHVSWMLPWRQGYPTIGGKPLKSRLTPTAARDKASKSKPAPRGRPPKTPSSTSITPTPVVEPEVSSSKPSSALPESAPDKEEQELKSPIDTTAESVVDKESAEQSPHTLRSRRSFSRQDSTESNSNPSITSETAGNLQSLERTLAMKMNFDVNELILARWTDCKNYPATVMRDNEDGTFEIRYHDGMLRTLKRDMLRKWDPNYVYVSKAKRRFRKQDKVENKPTQEATAERVTKKGDETSDSITTRAGDKVKSAPSNDKQESVVKDEKVAGLKPVRAALTYEAYYTRMAQESELSKFKCKVPGCNKVFRRESVLKQHHKHYHLQRYKLRDQELAPALKRKAAKEELPVAKRRVSSDSHLSVPSPKLPPTHPQGERLTRSRGGKPPLDVIQLTSEKAPLVTDDVASMKSKGRMQDPHVEDDVQTKTTTPPRRRRKKSDPPGHTETPTVDSSAAPNEDASSIPVEVVNEDVIRCVCEREDDVGFMLQCDSCLTWQHAKCEGIASPLGGDKRDSLPEYVCSVCKNPPGVRESQKHLFNNDFLSKGILPGALPLDGASESETERERRFQRLIMATHHLMEELIRMQESLQGIRMKIKIADPAHPHPLLRLWKEIGLDESAIEDVKSKLNLPPGSIQLDSRSPLSSSIDNDVADASHNETSTSRIEVKKESEEEIDPDVHEILQWMLRTVEDSLSSSRTIDSSTLFEDGRRIDDDVESGLERGLQGADFQAEDEFNETSTSGSKSSSAGKEAHGKVESDLFKTSPDSSSLIGSSVDVGGLSAMSSSETSAHSLGSSVVPPQDSMMVDTEATFTHVDMGNTCEEVSSSGASISSFAQESSTPFQPDVNTSSSIKPTPEIDLTLLTPFPANASESLLPLNSTAETPSQSTSDTVTSASSDVKASSSLESASAELAPQTILPAEASLKTISSHECTSVVDIPTGNEEDSAETLPEAMETDDSPVETSTPALLVSHPTATTESSPQGVAPLEYPSNSVVGTLGTNTNSETTPVISGETIENDAPAGALPPEERSSSEEVKVPGSSATEENMTQEKTEQVTSAAPALILPPPSTLEAITTSRNISSSPPAETVDLTGENLPVGGDPIVSSSASRRDNDRDAAPASSCDATSEQLAETATFSGSAFAAALAPATAVSETSTSYATEDLSEEPQESRPFEESNPELMSCDHSLTADEEFAPLVAEVCDDLIARVAQLTTPSDTACSDNAGIVEPLPSSNQSTTSSQLNLLAPSSGSDPCEQIMKRESISHDEQATDNRAFTADGEVKSSSATEEMKSELDLHLSTVSSGQGEFSFVSTKHEQTTLDTTKTEPWNSTNKDMKPLPRERRRSRMRSDDTQEEILLRSRFNLLQHIHRLEVALSDRLTQLEDYVATLELAFSRLLGSATTSSGSQTPFDSRLGELRSDLHSLYKDVGKVEKMFSSSS